MGSEYEQNLIVCTSASKSFNIAGLQNSDILIPNPSNRAAYNRVLTSQHLMSCNYLGILATEAAYRGGQDWLEAVTAYLEENRNYLIDFISKNCNPIGTIIPQATYMAWLDCRGLSMTEGELEQFFIHQARVGVNMGEMCIRDRSIAIKTHEIFSQYRVTPATVLKVKSVESAFRLAEAGLGLSLIHIFSSL